MTGRYKAYPEYKESDVDWLGVVPSHWDMTKTSRYYKVAMGQTILKEDLVDEGKWPVFSATENNHYFGRIDSPNVRLQRGDIVIPARGNSIGAVKLVNEPASTTQTTIYCKLLKQDGLFQSYIYYFLVGERRNLFRFTQTAIPQITTEEVGNNPLLLPSFEEQQKIANFLDHETAKIDTLITKQEKLIELLKEKRQAVISHAVTKGLNPDAPMKDSGVEWLGEVPEHWIASKLKNYTIQIVDGSHFTPTYTESGVPFLRVTDVTSKAIDFNKIKYIPKSEHKELIKRCNPQKGDLLLSKNGTIGVPKVIDWDYDFSIFVSLCLIKFKTTLLSTYSYYVFESHQIAEQINGGIKQSTVINLHLDKIENFYFSIPPIDEQQHIVDELNRKTNKFDTLIAKAEEGINLIKERKTALISAAVTGKIDVRDWQGEA